jgi:hypothetical protein
MPNFEKGPNDSFKGWNALEPKNKIQAVTLNQSATLQLAWGRDLELRLLKDEDGAQTDLASDTSAVEVTHGDLG